MTDSEDALKVKNIRVRFDPSRLSPIRLYSNVALVQFSGEPGSHEFSFDFCYVDPVRASGAAAAETGGEVDMEHLARVILNEATARNLFELLSKRLRQTGERSEPCL